MISFYNAQWWLWIALATLLLVVLTWRSLKTPRVSPFPWLAFTARVAGILILAIALADPHLSKERPITGANVLAILADNSESLRAKESGEILDRGESMRQSLSGRDSEWIGSIEESYQVRNYLFDRSLRRIGSFASLDFSGDRSNLAQALSEIDSRLSKLPVAGIALFTDGNATDDATLPDDLSGLPPVFPIIVGSESPQPDLAVREIQLQQSAFDDAPLNLRAQVSATELPSDRIDVTLSRISNTDSPSGQIQKETVATKRIRVEPGGDETARFEWTPTRAGVQFYEVTAEQSDADEGEPSEATLQNNRRLLMADGGKQGYRILYVSGRPNWEYKFLNRALADDPQLDLVALMRVADREPKFEFKGRSGESSNPLYRGFGREDETERYDQAVLVRLNTKDEHELRAGFPAEAEELFAYDAVVIDDVEAEFFTYSQLALIREFVNQRGGGLLMLGGASSLNDGGYRDSPLAQALPIYLDRPATLPSPERGLAWDLTREGWVEPWARIRSIETEEQLRLDRMPLLKVINALPHVKPGARTLAVVQDQQGEALPALVTRNFGSGRIACIAVGDLWRWGLQGPQEQADLARFWRQTARWLVKDAPRQVQLEAQPDANGSIRIMATAREADYRPVELGRARLKIRKVASFASSAEQPDDSSFASIELSMEPVANSPGQFNAVAPLIDAGAYLATVEVTDANNVPIGSAETGWVSEPAVAEYASLKPNRALLERIAAATGGRVLEFNQLDELAVELANRPSPLMETWSEPIWHKSWVFALALACFLVEWASRRRKGYA